MQSTVVSSSEAVKRLREVSQEVPKAAVLLGSGVEVLEDIAQQKSYSFQEIFGIAPTVEGHSGSFSLGKLDGQPVAVLRGRFHFYEGYDTDIVTLATRVIVEWGVPSFYLTNACGAINPAFDVGDLMLLTGYRDHISAQWRELGMLPSIKVPPTDCQNELTKHIWKTAEEVAHKNKDFRPLHRGVYAGWLGPCYETLAEIGMLHHLKADVVGMSTVPELIAAANTKTQAAAISVITNSWNKAKIHGHKEVLEAAKAASQRLDILLRAAILAQSAG